MIAVQVQVATDDAGFIWICKYKLYRLIQAWLCTGCPSTTSTQPCLLFSFMQKRLAVYSMQMLLHYNSCCVLYKLWNKSELNAPRSSNNMLWANVEFAYHPMQQSWFQGQAHLDTDCVTLVIHFFWSPVDQVWHFQLVDFFWTHKQLSLLCIWWSYGHKQR